MKFCTLFGKWNKKADLQWKCAKWCAPCSTVNVLCSPAMLHEFYQQKNPNTIQTWPEKSSVDGVRILIRHTLPVRRNRKQSFLEAFLSTCSRLLSPLSLEYRIKSTYLVTITTVLQKLGYRLSSTDVPLTSVSCCLIQCIQLLNAHTSIFCHHSRMYGLDKGSRSAGNREVGLLLLAI